MTDNRLMFVKTLGGLRPAEPRAEEWLMRVKLGACVAIEQPKLPRNPDHHRLYWALVALVWQNKDHDQYPTQEDLHAAIKIAAGLRTRIELPDGTVAFRPGSIAWSAMDQTEFSAFYDRVCDLVARYFLPGVTSRDLKAEVELMIGVTPAQLQNGSTQPRRATS